VLKIKALEAGVPKSFSRKVAYPIDPAKASNNKVVSRCEKSIFLMDFSIKYCEQK
jgi:hypothetical protein